MSLLSFSTPIHNYILISQSKHCNSPKPHKVQLIAQNSMWPKDSHTSLITLKFLLKLSYKSTINFNCNYLIQISIKLIIDCWCKSGKTGLIERVRKCWALPNNFNNKISLSLKNKNYRGLFEVSKESNLAQIKTL